MSSHNPKQSLRPSLDTFRRMGWHPATPEHYHKWMGKLHKRVHADSKRMPGPGTVYKQVDDAPELLEPIQEFKEFIENNAVVYTDIVRMFDQVPKEKREEGEPSNYFEMLTMFNIIFREAPKFGSLGPPMYMIMAKVMDTNGGFSAFTKMSLNHHFKKMLKTWELFLLSPDSTSVLDANPDGGWFQAEALKQMMEHFDGKSFQDVFVCQYGAPAWGFTSYEDFFIRRFREPLAVRPLGADVTDLRAISAACESAFYALKTNVQKVDQMFIKDEAYSLVHLLANDESVDSFIGGSVIQSFLNTTGYHRWHAPVSGFIKKIVDVPGTYFAQAPDLIGQPLDDPNDPNYLPPYLRSLTYFSNVAARQLIFIESDNPKIGLMCFISIGMTEISTCQATVYEGQHVNRGDELGMFHFGGSSCALVFNGSAKLNWNKDAVKKDAYLLINSVIAECDV